MKKAEIKVGGLYLAKVSGKLTTVRVDSINEESRYAGKLGTYYQVTNLRTGRRTTFRSAAKFRCAVLSLDVGGKSRLTQPFVAQEINDAVHNNTETGTNVGPTGPSGDRGNFTPRPGAGPAAASPAGPVVAAEAAGDGEPRQLDWCGDLQCRGF